MCQLELIGSEPIAKAKAENRIFYRCLDCLAVFAIETDGGMESLHCACGGNTDCMGVVCGDSLQAEETRCACDARCTEARGPMCDCKCGGDNHGTGAVVTVTRRTGEVPKACNAPNAAKGAAWREQVAAAREAVHSSRAGAAYARRNAGEYIEDWRLYLNAKYALQEIRRAQELKAWPARYNAIKKALSR